MKQQLTILTALLFALFVPAQNEQVDQLILDIAFQTKDSAKVDSSIKLIEALYKAEDYKKALLYIDQTQQLASKINYTKGNAEANYYRALIYSDKNDYFNALDNYNKSRNFYTQLNDTLGIAKVSNSIGLIEIKRGNYSTGLKNSLSAIAIFEKRNLRDELSKAYSNLAEAYHLTNQIEKALEFNQKALKVRTQLGDSTGMKLSTKNIALLYSKRKEHRKAIEFYEQTLSLLNPKTDQDLRGEILPRIGYEYLQFREYDKATNYLLEGLEYNRETKNQEGILISLNAIGNLNIEQNKLKLAEIQLAEALTIAEQTNNKNELLKNYRLQIALDSTRGFYQNAFNWQRKYFNLKETLTAERQPQTFEETENSTAESILDSSITNETDHITSKSEIDKKYEIATYLLGIGLLIALISLFVTGTQYNKAKQAQIGLAAKNKQLTEHNAVILEQTQHLEEINKVKDRLFSIVSHDLKDSISSIKGFLDLLKEDSITKEEFNELIPELSENANNASLLLYNLLNWSKSQMQNLEPKPELFNIQEVFQTKISLIEQKAEQKRLAVIDESQRDHVYADRSMIEIVIQNLLTNAVKFSRVGDVITVSSQDFGDKVRLSVEDTGVGISKENMDKLFKNDAFTTIGTKNEKGTGLGLTICKELVELNNGKIWVESTPNVGSKFFVELPKAVK
ncbi:tetratricopeptide repeat protein [Paucihalobacter ruber]|uniref:histidine kinase n=1 Tax=Paucihalobacter ruber TaxID=2567861 RepID=A0A506PK03_9FLAO|nr:ATP-binding protein [Paucihalobacter ruber]TPV34133.1 tetratricopeptide repeat protein [Paucihalobacter ruber]